MADEQVDANGCSWRSGAKVEKKLLKQWFVKTTKFAKQLLDGLEDPTLVDWRDIIKLQKHWIGECTGYSFDLKLVYTGSSTSTEPHLKLLTVWTVTPEDLLEHAAFVAISKDHVLNKLNTNTNGILNVRVVNPFSIDRDLPIIVSDGDVEFPAHCDTYIGVPMRSDTDRDLAHRFGIRFNNGLLADDAAGRKEHVVHKAKVLNIGGYLVSSKLKDWLISRQRYWGTPIPIVHCNRCGPVPMNEKDLPVLLSPKHSTTENVKCPSCGNEHAQKESDTMDTFVDSSWYFLRYLDPNNDQEVFNKKLSTDMMPVDLYIGGKEHAVLHLYYARFFNHFLHSIGLVPQPEPFQRLLVQGMVMGQSFRVKGTGKYLKEDEVRITNAKKNQAEEVATGSAVVMQWEKMSKSKLNGVDPAEAFAEHSTDTIRLIMLGDVAPTSHRNWSSASK